MIRNELEDFLRSRREAVQPTDVGLPAGPRRQTPGLRRSELATLAGISVEYLTRLEQGRDARPSVQVLAAVAEALRLPSADRAHLQDLAVVSQGTDLCAGRPAASRTVRPTVQAMLDRLDPAPAYVINHLTEVVAWNDTFELMFRTLGLLDAAPANLTRFLLMEPRARDAFNDWSTMVDEQIAYLHSNRHGDPEVSELANDLAYLAGAEFTDRWRQRPVAWGRTGRHNLKHPDVGPLSLTFESLKLADHDNQRMIVYLPADHATSARLDRLFGRHPGALHSVTTPAGS